MKINKFLFNIALTGVLSVGAIAISQKVQAVPHYGEPHFSLLGADPSKIDKDHSYEIQSVRFFDYDRRTNRWIIPKSLDARVSENTYPGTTDRLRPGILKNSSNCELTINLLGSQKHGLQYYIHVKVSRHKAFEHQLFRRLSTDRHAKSYEGGILYFADSIDRKTDFYANGTPFEQIGFQAPFVDLAPDITPNYDSQLKFVLDSTNGQWVEAGVFYSPNLGNLTREFQRKNKRGIKGRLNLLEGPNEDVRRKISDPNYNGATFQVASDFDGKETTSPKLHASGRPFERLANDPTQGPAAEIMTAPASRVREEAGTHQNPLYFLGIRLVNGYPMEHPSVLFSKMNGTFDRDYDTLRRHLQQDGYDSGEIDYLLNSNGIPRQQLPKNQQEVFDRFEVACVTNTPVVYEVASDRGHNDIFLQRLRRTQNVNLVLTSTINMNHQLKMPQAQFCVGCGEYNRLFKRDYSASNRRVSQIVLNASYRSVFLQSARDVLADVNPNRRVVLTLLGGGAFANDPEDIIDAICTPENAQIIRDYGLQVELNISQLDPGQKSKITRFAAGIAS